MTFATYETSVQTAAPVELYEFTYGDDVYRYTSADVAIDWNGETYARYPISRGAIEATQEKARLDLELNCSPDLPVLDLFIYAPPDEVVTVTIRRLHRGDTDAAVIWMGRVLSVNWRGPDVGVHCESVYTSVKRPGLRRMYQKSCPHVLYSTPCGLDRAAWVVRDWVASIDGTAITVNDLSAYATGYFAGGYVEWTGSDGHVERRAIVDHTGDVLTVSFQMLKLAAEDSFGYGENWGNYYGGLGLAIYTGCDHSLATCDAKFANSLNYGGMPYTPSKNPFDGTPVF